MKLELDHVSAGYGDIGVLRDVSVSAESGSVLGIAGRNGMGKSTLIRTMAGLITPSAGTVILDGVDVTREPSHARARRGLTTIVQGRGIFANLSVREHLTMGRVAGQRGKRDRLAEVLSYFPRLEERLRQRAGTLSGGEQQMLAIGTGLMTDPNVMLLDEPSDGIMPTLVEQIGVQLREINRRESMTIVVVEQNLPMIFAMADRCVVLENGTVVLEGDAEQLAAEGSVHKHLALAE
ncbi:urea ABC transporter ATP-binding protein [Salinisphaera orenii MK-B5]|uniref:Urea ABC transporter ATP-binding protein n=1 Tax=Salinisphaera orenii MK-B5 TaxID=856730 RepID=A0A423PGU3_9GAMM|nr:ABC transporter ATP-binding protein [Salinisphaera orenii]ROO24696.1 urea ABC transporter ATP-binding protein [Salinisphaera orenii MK-B5]